MMLGREEAQRLLRERWEAPVGDVEVTRVTRRAADGSEPAPLDELGYRIVEIVTHQNAAEYELLTLLAEFDERQGWVLSHDSCLEWLVHHTGESACACRERLRIARVIRDLPQTSASMARGELGYTKVKEITRLATPENEAELVECGRHATVRELKRVLSGYKIHSRKGEEALAEWQQDQRALTVHQEVTGLYKLFGDLPPEAGVFIMGALEHFGREIHGTNTDVTPPQRFADALVHALELAMAADQKNNVPTSGNRPAHTAVHLHVDPGTIAALSGEGAQCAGGAEGRRGADTKNAATSDSQAGEHCHLQDGTRVTRVTALRMLCDAAVTPMAEDPHGKILNVGRKTRTISPALRRALDARDARCRFPHCENRMTDAHHIVHWAHGGETKLDNLVLLCRHHHTLVHERGYTMKMDSRGKVQFKTPNGVPVPNEPNAVALAGRIEGALLRRNRARGVDPWGWGAVMASRKLPWEVEARTLAVLDS